MWQCKKHGKECKGSIGTFASYLNGLKISKELFEEVKSEFLKDHDSEDCFEHVEWVKE